MSKLGLQKAFLAKLFYKGNIFRSILMHQAYKDLDFCCDITKVDNLYGVSATRLMARIRRYADGRSLKEPTEINVERIPFFAIKDKTPPNGESWEDFKNRKGDMEKELSQLRAYFWHDEDNDLNKLMCITHFIQKTQPKMKEEDVSMCRDQKFLFEKNQYFYD